jgi:choline monooxygenase
MSLDTTLPSRYYVDPAVYEIERHTIFAPAWNLVAYQHQLSQPGDFVTEDLAGWPIFVRRNPDGSLGGFLNVCPHRAGPIVPEGPGCQANLVCRYHGWAFDQDGALLSARDFGAELADGPGLTPIRVQSWRGMVFVCLSPDTPDLLEWLGGFPQHCEQYPLEAATYYCNSVRHVAMNWKAYVDNYNEGYHLPLAHQTTLGRAVDSSKYRVMVGEGDPRWTVHEAPPKDGTEWTGVWGWFWPTFSINIFGQGWAIERWLPRGHDRTDVLFEYFFEDDAVGIEEIVKESELVADEDAAVCAHVQRAMASGAYDVGVLSPRHEYHLAMFADLLREAVDPYLAVGSPAIPLGLPVMRARG